MKGLYERRTKTGEKRYRGKYNSKHTPWTTYEEACRLLAILQTEGIQRRKSRKEKIKQLKANIKVKKGIESWVNFRGETFYRARTTVNRKAIQSDWTTSYEEACNQLENAKSKKIYASEKQKEAIKQLELDEQKYLEKHSEPKELLNIPVDVNGKIKGIEERTTKQGETKYRAATFVNGKRVRTAWTSSYEEAYKQFIKMSSFRVAVPHKNRYTVNDKDIRMSEFLELYFEYIKTRYKPNTQRNIRSVLTKIYRHKMDMPLSEISKVDVMPHLRVLVKKISAARNISVLKMLQEYAKAFEYPYTINIARLWEEIRNYAASDEKIKFISKEEVAEIFKYIDDSIVKIKARKKFTIHAEKSIKDYQHFKLAIKIALYGGLRRSEVLGLRYKDIQLDKRIINVISVQNLDGTYKIGTKNGKTRIVPMADHVKLELQEFMNKDYKADSYIFEGYNYHFIQVRMDALNVAVKFRDTYGFHTFRHTFASLFFKLKGTSPEALVDLQQILGHQHINTTMHYVHVYKTYTGNILDGLSYGEAEKIEAQRKEEEKETLISATVALKILSDQIRVETPYDKDLIPVYEGMGGVFNKESRCWIFDLSTEKNIRNILKERFGYEPTETIEDKIKEMQKQLATLISIAQSNNGLSNKIS